MAAIFESLAVTGSRRNDGTPNATGKAWFYKPGTQTLATVYPDAAQSAPLSNPVTLNAGGKATVYFAGQVDVFIEDSTGLPISTLTLSERAERVEVRNAGFTGTLPSGSLGAGGTTDLNTVLSSIAASVGGSDALVKEYTNATGRKIVDKFREMLVSVKDYGAVGNGIADDSTPIQRAANEVARLGGGILYFPPGTYLVSSAPNFSSANVIIRGSGQTTAILRITTTASGLLAPSGLDTLFIEDIALDCTGSNVGTALQMVPTTLAIVSRVKITNFTFGIVIDGASPGRTIIRDCDITTVAGATARGIKINVSSGFGSGMIISGCRLNVTSGQSIELAGNLQSVAVGPGNQFLTGTALHANNSGTSLKNILFFCNSGGALVVTGADAIIRQFGNGIDGVVTDAILLSGGAYTPDRTLGSDFGLTGNTTGTAYTINAPTPAPRADAIGLELTLVLKNNAGGAITGWTLDPVYHKSAVPSNVNGERTTYRFRWEGTIWRELTRSVTT